MFHQHVWTQHLESHNMKNNWLKTLIERIEEYDPSGHHKTTKTKNIKDYIKKSIDNLTWGNRRQERIQHSKEKLGEYRALLLTKSTHLCNQQNIEKKAGCNRKPATQNIKKWIDAKVEYIQTLENYIGKSRERTNRRRQKRRRPPRPHNKQLLL